MHLSSQQCATQKPARNLENNEMMIYIAFLRGINVGGKNKIKMADLKRVLESAGLARVETYIQSGNIIFESDEIEEALRTKIEREIEKNFGFFSAVILRSFGELEQLIQRLPFSQEEITEAEAQNSEGESLYVSLMAAAPAPEKSDFLTSFQTADDACRINSREVYLLLRHSIRNSKLANSLQKLEAPGTVRNWKTICKLHALAKSRKPDFPISCCNT